MPILTQKQRIQTVRDMAEKMRDVASVNRIDQFFTMEYFIEKDERGHRQQCGGPSRYSQPVAVAVDYYIVRCFARAFADIQEAQTKEELLACLDTRIDHLLAFAVLAGYRERFTSSIDVRELIEASEMVDYGNDIVGR